MRIVSTIGAERVVHEGVTYQSEGDGLFEVPEPVGLHLTGFPDWLTEWQALDRRTAADQAHASDPAVLAAEVAELRDRVAALEAAAKPKRPSRAKPADDE